MKIRTTFDYPPIPVRDFDWSAIDEDTYDCDCDQDGFFSLSPIGRGRTEQEAISDLMDRLADQSTRLTGATTMKSSQLHADSEPSPLWNGIRKLEDDNNLAAARILKLEADLREVERISDNITNAEHYTPLDALNDLQEIRLVIKRSIAK